MPLCSRALLLALNPSSTATLDRLSKSRSFYSASDQTTCAPTVDRDTAKDLYALPGLVTTRPLPFNASQSYPFWLPLSYASSVDSLPPIHGQLLPLLLQHLSTPSSTPTRLPRPLQPLRNTTILLFGDSNERALVDSFCINIVGKEAVVRRFQDASASGAKWHADPHVCEVDLGVDAVGERSWLRIVGVMMFGVLVQTEEEGELLWGTKKAELEGPWTFPERVKLARHFLERLDEERGEGQVNPPILHVSSTLWDLMYANDYSYFSSLPSSPLTFLASHSSNPFAPSSSPSESTWGWQPSQVSHYLNRFSSALPLLQETFPSSPPIMLRTLHPLAHVVPPARDFWNPLRISQLNSAIRAASSPSSSPSHADTSLASPLPQVELFDLHRILDGMPETELLRNGGKDRVHLEWKTAGWIWMEGILEGVVWRAEPRQLGDEGKDNDLE